MHQQNQVSTFRKIVVGLATVLLIAGCAGVSVPTDGPVLDTSIPNWWTGETQRVDGAIHGFGTGRSTEMSVARGIARQLAINEIGQFQQQESAGEIDLMQELAGTADSDVIQLYTNASRVIWSEELVGVRQANQAVLRDGNMYIVYLLMEQDPAAVAAAYEAQMKEQVAAFARFRATEVFKKMEENIRLYEQRRRQN